LEDNGWIIHRIWSTDWFQRPREQLRKTIAAIEAAKVELEVRGLDPAQQPSRAAPIEIVTVGREETAEIGLEMSIPKLSVPYRVAAFPIPSSIPLRDVPADLMGRVVHQIAAIEGPVHEDEIVVRVRSLWGLQRAGNRIQAAVTRGLSSASRTSTLLKDGKFYSVPGGEILIRDRSTATSPSLRKPEMLPPQRCGLPSCAWWTANTEHGETKQSPS